MFDDWAANTWSDYNGQLIRNLRVNIAKTCDLQIP